MRTCGEGKSLVLAAFCNAGQGGIPCAACQSLVSSSGAADVYNAANRGRDYGDCFWFAERRYDEFQRWIRPILITNALRGRG